MVGKASYVMARTQLWCGSGRENGRGRIGCCCSSTKNEGGHVCTGNGSRDATVACTRRLQQQQQKQQQPRKVNSSTSRGRSAAAAAGGRGWGRRGWIVRWIPSWVRQHAGRGDSVCTRECTYVLHGRSRTIIEGGGGGPPPPPPPPLQRQGGSSVSSGMRPVPQSLPPSQSPLPPLSPTPSRPILLPSPPLKQSQQPLSSPSPPLSSLQAPAILHRAVRELGTCAPYPQDNGVPRGRTRARPPALERVLVEAPF